METHMHKNLSMTLRCCFKTASTLAPWKVHRTTEISPEFPQLSLVAVASDGIEKKNAEPVMQLDTEATDGSYSEFKDTDLVWHHQYADPDFIACQTKELLDHLENVLANEPMVVKRCQHIVEVKAQHAVKSEAFDFCVATVRLFWCQVVLFGFISFCPFGFGLGIYTVVAFSFLLQAHSVRNVKSRRVSSELHEAAIVNIGRNDIFCDVA
ncbi:hypothetical protein ZIOFF_017101 [Zingiber officinale]|uniref:Uncharacterized protein n=1 Tax=Zingiber officinale TaxID=94328 RepID=A0A8J5HRB2_ZINOF|nr:hypothetical protein ZIOFF_017101 [Zingiber officinale]